MLAITNEFLVAFCSIMLIGYMDGNQDEKITEIIGYVFIGVVCTIVIINWILIVPAQLYLLFVKIVSFFHLK